MKELLANQSIPSKSSGSVAGLVLAAGASTRMGSNKLLLQLDGESLLRRTVGRALSAELDPMIVVVGFEADRTVDELAGLSCHVVTNPDYERGLNESLRAGIRAVPVHATAVLVMLADMPNVSTEMIKAMVSRYRAGGSRLVISDYGGVNAPPILYDRSLFQELETLRGGDGGKELIRRHRDEALVVTWPAEALDDLDLPEDYERARARLS